MTRDIFVATEPRCCFLLEARRFILEMNAVAMCMAACLAFVGLGCSGHGEQDGEPTSSISSDLTSTITVGVTTILTGADNGNANLLISQQVSLGQTATIQSLSFYVTGVAGA